MVMMDKAYGCIFYDNKIPKVDSNHACLAVISLSSALKKHKIFYPQVFLKECKYIEKNVIKHVNDNLSDFYSSDESYEEYMFLINTYVGCFLIVYH